MADRHIYDPGTIEPKWQDHWDREGVFKAVEDDDGRPRFYNLQMFPYPSGDMHMGHAEAFSVSDAIGAVPPPAGRERAEPDRLGRVRAARRERGHQARHPPQGVDVREHRPAAVHRCTGTGCAFDWDRQFNTCDPEYYQWTQWLFLQLFDRGLAYRKLAPANWCPKDQTVLANEQVIARRGASAATRWSCGAT